MKKVIGYKDIIRPNGEVLKRAIYKDLGPKLNTTLESPLPSMTLRGKAKLWQRRDKER